MANRAFLDEIQRGGKIIKSRKLVRVQWFIPEEVWEALHNIISYATLGGPTLFTNFVNQQLKG